MLTVAVILLIVGVVLLVVFYSGLAPDGAIRASGVVALLLGVILLIVWAVVSSGDVDVEHAGFIVPGWLGMTAVPPARPRRRREERSEGVESGSGEIRRHTDAAPPVDPKPNKALVAAVGTIVTVGLRWLVSGELNLSDEGLIGLAGALTTVLVYLVSNWKRLLGS